ncbi:MAG: NUDIX hydrolase [Acidilobaceae archaeon]|nr:NUDIX hydrolase [Acidilobaceae archaeon]
MKVSCKGRRVLFESELKQLPNGVTALVDRVVFPNSVAVLPVWREERKVVLIKQYRPSIDRWILEVPAGVIDSGEGAEEAAARELEEEAGLRPGRLEEVARGYVSPGYSTEYLALYIAWEPLEGNAAAEDHEVIEKRLTIDIDEALRMVERGEIEDVKTVLLLFAAASRVRA